VSAIVIVACRSYIYMLREREGTILKKKRERK
jgi:hypothetical protein